ncbi:MAG: carbon-nitrogen hydrolase family protein [Pacificimonas sp.]
MTTSFRIGIIQMTSGIDPAANAETLVGGIGELAADGARIIFTPEMSGLLDKQRERLLAVACNEDDDIVLAAVKEAAKAHNIWVQLGSLAVRVDRGDKLANRSVLIDDEGEVVARYDKIHLFDVDLGGGERYGESKAFIGGDRAVVHETPVGKLGLSICYDIRFPRLYDALTQAGAELLSIPAAFTRPTGKAHWHLLARARAVETTSFVVAAAQTGEHEDGRATYGHSLVVDPWGEVLLDMGETAGVATCDIDLAVRDKVHARLPVRDHRTHIISI